MLISLAIPPVAAYAEAAVEALVAVNFLQLSSYVIPPLYTSGVRYRREPAGRERWQTAIETLGLGYGDCEDLASWRAAELRAVEGEPATVAIIRTGKRRFHAVVRRADGSLEDPSRRLR